MEVVDMGAAEWIQFCVNGHMGVWNPPKGLEEADKKCKFCGSEEFVYEWASSNTGEDVKVAISQPIGKDEKIDGNWEYVYDISSLLKEKVCPTCHGISSQFCRGPCDGSGKVPPKET